MLIPFSYQSPDRIEARGWRHVFFPRCFNLASLNRKIFDVDGDEVFIWEPFVVFNF